METDNTIGIGDVDKAGEQALGNCWTGFRIIKTKVGISEEEDIQRLRNIRKAVGDNVEKLELMQIKVGTELLL